MVRYDTLALIFLAYCSTPPKGPDPIPPVDVITPPMDTIPALPPITIPPPVVPPIPVDTSTPPPPVAPRTPIYIVTHMLDPWAAGALADLQAPGVRFTIYVGLWGDPGYRASVASSLANVQDRDVLLVLNGWTDARVTLPGFIQAAKEIHALYPNAALQLWNEVDLRWTPGNGWTHFGGDPARFVAHVRDVRSVLPYATLVGPGLASDGDLLARWVTALDRAPLDALAVHTYGVPLPFASKHATASAHTSKPIWVTEFGVDRGGMPGPWLEAHFAGDWEAAQAHLIREAVRDYGGLYQRVYLYALEREGDQSESITRPDRSPRPSYEWVKHWNGSR
jgi:hypothetical protein